MPNLPLTDLAKALRVHPDALAQQMLSSRTSPCYTHQGRLYVDQHLAVLWFHRRGLNLGQLLRSQATGGHPATSATASGTAGASGRKKNPPARLPAPNQDDEDGFPDEDPDLEDGFVASDGPGQRHSRPQSASSWAERPQSVRRADRLDPDEDPEETEEVDAEEDAGDHTDRERLGRNSDRRPRDGRTQKKTRSNHR